MKFTPHTFAQRSGAWRMARVGRLTSSGAEAMLASVKKGEAKTRAQLRARLVCERLTGRDEERDYTNSYMDHGEEYEAEALRSYEAETGEIVRRVGFLSCDEVMAGCSPDGYLGSLFCPDVIVEVKCPKAANHLAYVKRNVIPTEYVAQHKHLLWVSGAESIHFVSYCPFLPEHLQLHIVKADRSAFDIAEYEDKAFKFLDEVQYEYGSLSGDALREQLTDSLTRKDR